MSEMKTKPSLAVFAQTDITRQKPPWSPVAFEPLESRTLLTAAQLDPAFNGSGEAISSQLPPAVDVAVQTDGKILTLAASKGSFKLTRYNLNGSLDTAFGSSGTVTANNGSTDTAATLAVTIVGKIVVVGTSGGNYIVDRFNADGTQDGTFNTGHFQTIDFGNTDTAKYVAAGTAGDIYVGGTVATPGGLSNVGIAHLTRDGQLDANYGFNGKFNGGGQGTIEQIEGMALQPDGRIVYGFTIFGGNTQSNGVSRLTTAGRPDGTSFTLATTSGTGFSMHALTLDSSGRILIDGQLGSGGPFISRFNTDGARDTTFGSDGEVRLSSANFANYDYENIVAQSDGKIIIDRFINGGGFSLARYNANGSVDTTFGSAGAVSTDFSGSGKSLSIALAPADKLVLAGVAGTGQEVGRYLVPLNEVSAPVAPTATLYQALRLRSSQKSYSFVVQYSNGGSLKDIDASTFDNGDITVTGPNGYSQAGQKLLVQSLKRGFLVTYAVSAPSHRWASTDNGIYTIHLNASQVSSNESVSATAADIGRFSVVVPGVVAGIAQRPTPLFSTTLLGSSQDSVLA